MTRVVLLTSDELRHRFARVATALDPALDVVRTYCEEPSVSLAATLAGRDDVSAAERRHLVARTRSEEDFFGLLCRVAPDLSNPVRVGRGAINEPEIVEQILELDPDVVATFGCSIVGTRLIHALPARIVNLHLGLSPYYRGSGTNFWPLVNDEPQLVGATFMYLDEGIDTGEIIHQVRARVFPGNGPHKIGNRLIGDAILVLRELLRQFADLGHCPQQSTWVAGREYRRGDVDADAVERQRDQFASGMVDRYLGDHAARIERAPIIEHPLLRDVQPPS